MWDVPIRAVLWITSNLLLGENMFTDLENLLYAEPNDPITTGIVRILFKSQHFCTSISRSPHFYFSSSLLTTLWHICTATSAKINSRLFVLCMKIHGWLCLNLLSVMMYLSHITIIPLSAVDCKGVCFSHDLETSTPKSRKIFVGFFSYMTVSVGVLARS